MICTRNTLRLSLPRIVRLTTVDLLAADHTTRRRYELEAVALLQRVPGDTGGDVVLSVTPDGQPFARFTPETFSVETVCVDAASRRPTVVYLKTAGIGNIETAEPEVRSVEA